MSGAEDDRDLLAAEYVLGVLEGSEREDVIRRADQDNALSAAITAWEQRLAPLATIVASVAPPAALWQRVEASCGLMAAPLSPAAVPALAETRRGFWNALRFWRGTTALGFGLTTAIAVVAVVNRPLPPAQAPAPAPEIPLASAVLTPSKGGGAPGFVAEATASNTIVVRPLERLAVASGKDYELWALPDGATVPKPLGVLPVAGHTVTLPSSLHGPMLLLVSLEQKGGSPTGLPQGPVLWLGHMSNLE
jgi:anti-sigma-K factor RskA